MGGGVRSWERAAVGVVGLLAVAAPAAGGMRTLAPGQTATAAAVREAMKAPTDQGQIEALIRVLMGEDLVASLEAMEALAGFGARAVPRLVSQMRRAKNNWLIGAALTRMGTQAVEPLVELLQGADEPTAVDCLYLLGEIQDRRAVPTLVKHLDDRRSKVRMYAVTALLSVGGPQAVGSVLTRLTRETKDLQGFMAESLLRYGRRSVDPVIQNLGSRDPKAREQAAFLLGGLGDARAVDGLVRALEDSDPAVRRNAAFALGELSGAFSGVEWVTAALTRALADRVESVVEAARGALVRYGPAAVPALLAVCRGGEPRTVVVALHALREIGSPEAEEVMIEFLRHPQRAVRVGAAAGLVSSGTGRAVEPLLDALRDDDLRWFAILALERVGPENPDLFFATRPNDPTLSLRTQILVRLGPQVVPQLTSYLRGDHLARKAIALWTLGEIGDSRSVQDVAGLLGDTHLGWLAGRALVRMGEEGLLALGRYLESASTDSGAIHAAESLAVAEDPRAWDQLERAVAGSAPRPARVRAAVLLTLAGDPQRAARLRTYLEGPGKQLWPDVEVALRAEGQIR